MSDCETAQLRARLARVTAERDRLFDFCVILDVESGEKLDRAIDGAVMVMARGFGRMLTGVTESLAKHDAGDGVIQP